MAVILDNQHKSDMLAFNKISEACAWLDMHRDKLYSCSVDIPQISTQRNTLCWVCTFPNVLDHYKQVLWPKEAVLHYSTAGW